MQTKDYGERWTPLAMKEVHICLSQFLYVNFANFYRRPRCSPNILGTSGTVQSHPW
jgi:hypothetical protein